MLRLKEKAMMKQKERNKMVGKQKCLITTDSREGQVLRVVVAEK